MRRAVFCFLKIHVAVNIKTKEILALEVTDEKVNDGRMLKKLVNHVLDNRGIMIESVLAIYGVHMIQTQTFNFLNRKELLRRE